MSTIKPHGGTLTTRLVSDDRIQALESEAQSLVTIQVPKREQCDIEADRLDSELSIIRYVAWAIPSVGFIGG